MWMHSLCLLLSRHCPPYLRGREHGQGMLEYAIIGGIVIVGAIATLAALSGALNQIFSRIAATLSQY
ncbi:MAG TPA: hypothetical protein VFL28_11435 [bacterium]|nr:hypothetical protein [bacterium]